MPYFKAKYGQNTCKNRQIWYNFNELINAR